MSPDGFVNYYVNSTRVGTRKDAEMLIKAFISIYGAFLSQTGYWTKAHMAEVTKSVRTRMLSWGCQGKDVTRVLNAFKKWVNDTY